MLVVINLYARIDIFKQIEKKHGQDVLKVVRKYERLLAKFMKLQADIKFIKTCKKEYLIPTLANVKLATRSGNKRLKLRLLRIIMEAEVQQKHREKSKVKKETRSIDISLRTSFNVIFYNCIIHQINIATKSKFKVLSKRHLKGATKLYFMHYVRVVIILFSTGLCKSALSTYSFGKTRFSSFCVLLLAFRASVSLALNF